MKIQFAGVLALMFSGVSLGQGAAPTSELPGARLSCFSAPGGPRTHCPADTSGGVALLSSSGTGACLLGRTWGYEASSIWVSDGCGGEFFASRAAAAPAAAAPPPAAPAAAPAQPPAAQPPAGSPEYIGNVGFKLYESDKGQIYMR